MKVSSKIKLEKAKAYRKANREKIRNYRKALRKANPEDDKKRSKTWRKANPKKAKIYRDKQNKYNKMEIHFQPSLLL